MITALQNVRQSKLPLILLHISGWVLFFSLPFIFMPKLPAMTYPAMPAFPPVPPMPVREVHLNPFLSRGILLLNGLLFIYFYLNAYWLMPKLFSRKKYWFFTLITICLLLLVLFVPEKVHLIHRGNNVIEFRRRSPDLIALFLFLVVFLLSSCIYIMRQWRNAERLNRAIENEQLTTELAFLRSQINPHFLFNTLNNIYTLAVTKSEYTGNAILKLSDMMRYVVTDAALDVVPLEKEIAYVKDFVELQKIRLTDKVTVVMDISGATSGCQVAPLLLITFIENAFKHGVSTAHASQIEIRLKMVNGKLDLLVKNNIHQGHQADISAGTGLTNAQRRLDLLYKNKHQLKIRQDNDTFYIHLLLDLV
ncbi:sensor histidine kinase [Ferruginibacter sp. HRS2-29]|uniref:sensor histidine kinase n=1 Tax=Ferruginibacter sp. HRS2-29 TaxID=2487334 RepID=UPI0020CB906B|nr:histidine kinase [Ferruginibacter sp. HRS2-29]MCP9749700.1 hypothetical protein [Ferruginibacter sp. HRS2-29]